MSSIIEHIVRYVTYLQDTHHLTISIHAPDFSGATGVERLIALTAHRNPYCNYIKSHSDFMWKTCIDQQHCVMRALEGSTAFFGMCHAGVCEYVYPFGHNGTPEGFICVSGYRPEEGSSLWNKACHKLGKLADKMVVPYEELMQIYKHRLSSELPSKELLDTLIAPICDMLLLAIDEKRLLHTDKKILDPQQQLFQVLCNYLKNNYNTDIRVTALSDLLHYSESYISHVFLKYSGKTIHQFVTELRIQEAKILLSDTELSIQEIALTVGYNDANYFTNVFRHHMGMSPRQWRYEAAESKLLRTKGETI
jgi:AraC-like DNA-binding protein